MFQSEIKVNHKNQLTFNSNKNSFLPGADITSVEPNIIPERGNKASR